LGDFFAVLAQGQLDMRKGAADGVGRSR
jgi:hypothetical protein